ncbi:Uncharacterized membrane protein YgcG, contains a TPM-fold domain [Paenibacillus sp. 1_12]|uniref:TPM domain-containing protein n=1 Tax=Paenibacillus sp. 1_12 TaxID=1566278 RepID=UPI0008EC561B|nr:TPM domain-containing protein [Paenibacillus sp. 1_12]SFL94918.1 Uncharacterized membrane protein YgcG, contains a TPM-fold domain [Paenibacillus sp. 1_12]
MRTIQLLVMLLFVFFFNSPIHEVYAANVPERSGVVTDAAGLFTADQVTQLRQALQGQSFELVVVTARGLDEETIQQFGNDVYNTWKLGANQLLLVVTDKPGTIQLVYDNEQVAKAVSGSEEGNAQGVIASHYSPLAAKGRIAEGIEAVSSYVNGLNVPVTKPSPQTIPNGAGTTPIQPSAPGGAVGSVTPTVPKVETPTATMPGSSSPQDHSSGTGAVEGTGTQSSSSSAMTFAIVGIVLLLVICVVVYMLRRSRRAQ